MRSEDLNVPKNILFKKRPFPFPCDSKRPQSECRLMYTGADTCCQQPYALAVTCDYPHHPPVIYNSAGTHMEEEQAASPVWAEGKRCTHKSLTYILRAKVSYGAAKRTCSGCLLYVQLIVERFTEVTGYETTTSRRGLCRGTKGKSLAGQDPGG